MRSSKNNPQAARERSGAAEPEDDSAESDISDAVEAELALLEAQEGAAAEETAPAEDALACAEDGKAGVDLQMERRTPSVDLSHLAPGEEALPDLGPADTSHDGPLVLPIRNDPPGTYHYELSHFLMQYADRYGLEGRILNGEAVLKLPPEVLGASGEGAVDRAVPLYEDAQLTACLRRRRAIINPAKLIARTLARGRFTSLRAPAFVDEAKAAAALGVAPGTALVVQHRPFAQLNYQLTLRYYRKEEWLVSPIFAVNEEAFAPAVQGLLEPDIWMRPGVEPGKTTAAQEATLSKLQHLAREQVRRLAVRRHETIQKDIDQDVQENIKILDEYYEEKAKELESEKRAVYFHLYYFEKEEAIDQQLAGIKKEKEERSRAMEQFWDVKIDVRLLSLGIFEIPFYAAADAPDRAVDGLTGRVLFDDGQYIERAVEP
jgi:hypothetical protein